MKTTLFFTRFLFTSLALMLIVMSPQKVEASSRESGAQCQPANLNQALAFGLGWSQFGVANNAPIGGQAFFVVCPIENDTAVGNSLVIDVRVLTPGAAQVVCTVYEGFTDVPLPFANIQTSPIATPQNQYLTHTFTLSPTGYERSLVCALQPQTGIANFSME